MYFILVNDSFSDRDYSLQAPQNLPREVNFTSGAKIDKDLDTPLVFTTEATSGSDMLDFHRGTVTLMSKRFTDILNGAGVDNLQLIPAVIKSTADGFIWEDYYAVNILGMISCADLTKSTYTEIMPGHYRFKELAIHSKKANEALMFRLQEHAPSIIFHKSVGKYIMEQDPDEELIGWDADDIIQ